MPINPKPRNPKPKTPKPETEPETMPRLFKKPNSKLRKLEETLTKHFRRRIRVYSFGTLSGHTCHGAKDCLAWVQYRKETDDYKLEDGPDAPFRCFAASAEAVYSAAYNHRLDNMEFVRNSKSATHLALALAEDLPENADYVRIHDAGDIDSDKEFRAWLYLAEWYPDVVFYGYTKMLPLWVKYKNQLPENMVLTASRGGRFDSLISKHSLREAVVVFDESEASDLGLKLDQDDSSAARRDLRNQSFALLIHGQGAPGSRQAKIMSQKKTRVELVIS